MWCGTVVVVLLLWTTVPGSDGVVRIDNDGGYNRLVVAIDKSVPEDPRLITAIKEMFTNASVFLYKATKNQVFFREVIISLPSTWSSKPEYSPAAGDMFQNAEVRVDRPNPNFGNDPYTQQPGGCGDPGLYVHLTPDFILGSYNRSMGNIGTAGRQMVHEWAHLRYGVFDEYGIPGDSEYPAFYLEGGKIRPTTCTDRIQGWIDGGNEPCDILSNGLVGPNCKFIPDLTSDIKASIMYIPDIPTVEYFCEDSEGSLEHNYRAPSKHNILCNYKSTWSIISKHNDFRQIGSRPANNEIFPKFKILHQGTSSIVLVLDVSGSMEGRYMQLLHRSSTRFVADRIPDGAKVGLVKFSDDATILAPLTVIDATTKAEILAKIPTTSGGYTAIGKGLQYGLQVLGSQSQGGMIVLVTDGEENRSPTIKEVIPSIQQSGVTVNAVAFGDKASIHLEELIKATGGVGFYFNTTENTTAKIDMAFLSSMTSQYDLKEQPVTLNDERVRTQGKSHRFIYIDSQLGGHTVFTITSPDVERLQVRLISPKRNAYQPGSPEYLLDQANKQIRIVLEKADPGRWEIEFHSSGHTELSWVVTSEPRDPNDQPVRAKSWIGDLELTYPAVARVYAQVSKGYEPVLGASVVATVDRPMGSLVDIELMDNGAGADGTRDDGIYSAYFTQFNGNGRYSVVARVVNNGQAGVRLQPRLQLSRSPPLPKPSHPFSEPSSNGFSPDEFIRRPASHEPEKIKVIENFERSSSSGVFRVAAFPETGEVRDMFPPAPVRDLRVTNVEDDIVTLRWTSPGDNMDYGNVSYVEVRLDEDPEALLKNFTSSKLLEEKDLVNGTLSPPPGGQIHEISIRIPISLDQPKTIFFAVVGVDSSGLRADSWSIFPANLGKLGRPPPTFDLAWKIGIVIVIITLVIATALLIHFLKRRRQNQDIPVAYSKS